MSEKVTDPVCNMEISREAAFATITYEGKTYYFCAPSCRDKFKAAPEKYVEGKPGR